MTPKDNLNYINLSGKHKLTLMPDKFFNANLISNKNNYVQYPSNETDNESDHDYSRAPQITERPRKPLVTRIPINFEFGSNHDYTINTATSNILTDHQASTSND